MINNNSTYVQNIKINIKTLNSIYSKEFNNDLATITHKIKTKLKDELEAIFNSIILNFKDIDELTDGYIKELYQHDAIEELQLMILLNRDNKNHFYNEFILDIIDE